MRLVLLEILSLFCLSLILFTWGSNSQEVIGFDSRFYLFAQEMLHYGVNWFPTTYNQLYPDYPAASTFLIYLIAKCCGVLNRFVAILPTAIMSALTLTLTYLIGAIHHRRWGLSAVFFLLLTITFLKSARSIALDMYLVTITTGCFYLIYSADIKNKPLRVWLIYPLLLLGVVIRGPIGLVIPAGVVCSYYLLDGNFKKLFLCGFLAFILLMVSTICLLGIAYHSGGYTFMHNVLRMQVLGRIDKHFLPPYFYFTHSLESYSFSYPLAWIVFLGVIYYSWRHHPISSEVRFLKKLFGWMFVILLGMSIPGDKKIRYILPMIPAVALIAGYLFAIPRTEKYFVWMRLILVRILLFLPTLFLILIGIFLFRTNQNELFTNIHYAKIIMVLILLQALSLILFYAYANKASWRDLQILFCGTMTFVCSYISVVEPISLHIEKTRHFVMQVEKQRLQQNARLVFYKENPDGLPIKYLINVAQPELPFFIKDPQDLINFSQPSFFVTTEKYFYQLPKEIAKNFRIVAQDNLGHKKVFVFARSQTPLMNKE